MKYLTTLVGDCRETLKTLESQSVQCCVTSPPYFNLRNYNAEGQIGLESTPDEYVAEMVKVFREVRRVLKDSGTLWLNIGDSYNGSGKGKAGVSSLLGSVVSDAQHLDRLTKVDGCKPKDLIGIPWMLAFALRADGWYLRQDIIWNKPNPMPESVTDRCTKAHEYIFLLSKSQKYFYDAEAIAEPFIRRAIFNENSKGLSTQTGAGGNRNDAGRESIIIDKQGRNKRSVWTVPTSPTPFAHFATFPPDLIKPCILAGSKPGDVVLDPFGGSGTTAKVAIELGRKAVLCELNPEYVKLIEQRATTTIGFAFD